MSKVNLAEMDKIGQVFDRQGGYLTTGQSFIQANCTPRGYTGVLSFLQGHYQRCYDAGNTGMGNGVKIADKAATTIRANRAVYVESDRQAWENLRKHNPSMGPYQEPKGQLPAGALPQASNPSAGQRIWDGTKWVMSGGRTVLDVAGKGAGHAKTGLDWHNQGMNNSKKREQLKKLGDAADDKTNLFGKDTKWAEDPWGSAKEKASEYAKNMYAKARGFDDGDDQDGRMTERYRNAYREKADGEIGGIKGKETPDTPSAKKQMVLTQALDVIQKPAELVDTATDLYDEGKRALEEIDRLHKINALKNTNNKGSTEWANDGGGTW